MRIRLNWHTHKADIRDISRPWTLSEMEFDSSISWRSIHIKKQTYNPACYYDTRTSTEHFDITWYKPSDVIYWFTSSVEYYPRVVDIFDFVRHIFYKIKL